jgi:hypothetical protein
LLIFAANKSNNYYYDESCNITSQGSIGIMKL